MWPFSKPEREDERQFRCPVCEHTGDSGLFLKGFGMQDVPNDQRGPFCPRCIAALMNQHVPKMVKVEEKGNENAS